jgi:hypothetical protein
MVSHSQRSEVAFLPNNAATHDGQEMQGVVKGRMTACAIAASDYSLSVIRTKPSPVTTGPFAVSIT